MSWNAPAINGYVIEATDGRLETVGDLPFADVGWVVRRLVVDTGNWLPGRKVLPPLSALGHPNRALRCFPIKPTKQQVEDSPEVDTDRPVSWQIDAHVDDYFGWDSYWGGNFLPMSNAMATPFVAPLYEVGSNPHGFARADVQPNERDQHLRSIAAVTECHIQASDGEIGHVENSLVDDAGWNIRYIKVDTRNWWPGQGVRKSPRSVREINWVGKLVQINVNCQRIKDAPSQGSVHRCRWSLLRKAPDGLRHYMGSLLNVPRANI